MYIQKILNLMSLAHTFFDSTAIYNELDIDLFCNHHLMFQHLQIVCVVFNF